MPHAVPLIVRLPLEVITEAELVAKTPKALPDEPLPLTPVIVTAPEPVVATRAEVMFTPSLTEPPPARPSSVIFPPVVFTLTVEPLIRIPSNVPA